MNAARVFIVSVALACLLLAACAAQSDEPSESPVPSDSNAPSDLSIDFEATEDVDNTDAAFTPETGEFLTMVAVTGSQAGFVAVGRESEFITDGLHGVRGQTWLSTDGINWERNPLDENADLLDVVAFRDGYIAVGVEEEEIDGSVWTSSDGKAWTRLTVMDGKPVADRFGTRLSGLTIVGDRVYAAGNEGTGTGLADTTATVWESRDGTSWTRLAADDESLKIPTGFVIPSAIAGDENMLVMVGVSGGYSGTGADDAMIWCSATGEQWTYATGPDLYDGESLLQTSPKGSDVNDVALGPGGFVAVGQYGDEPRVWQSADGCTWTQSELDVASRMQLSAVASDGSRFTIVGYEEAAADEAGAGKRRSLTPQPDDRSAAWMSDDGQDWTAVEFEPDPDIAHDAGQMLGIAVFANGDIAVGNEGPGASTWTISLDD